MNGEELKTVIGKSEIRSAEGDEIISKKELAARLSVTIRTIERWQRAGHLPYLKVTTVILFNWPEVVAHLKAKYRVAVANGGRREA